MRILVQRVTNCEVWIEEKLHSSTGSGLLIFHGTKKEDKEKSCGILADKILNLRIFEDSSGKMNISALEVEAEIMIVSQFTLYADTKKGRRPSFTEAMEPKEAEKMYSKFVHLASASGLKTSTGIFGAKMEIKLTNHGPVTILLDNDL